MAVKTVVSPEMKCIHLTKMILKKAIVIFLTLSWITSCADGEADLPPDAIVVENFDSRDWDDWISEGNAFGNGPCESAYLGEEMRDKGFTGGFADSHFKGDEAKGRLISPVFTIQKKYLNFLITGNAHYNAEDCQLRLVIEDSTVRYAPATRSPLMEWACFDMEELIGKMAHIEITDHSEKTHIMVDMIFQSSEMKLGPGYTTLTAEKKYLLFPVQKGGKQYRIRLEKEGDVTEQFVIEMGPGEPDFWAFRNISQYAGKRITIRSHSPVKPEGFDRIFQDDTVPGQNGFYKEGYRPQFHFTATQGWINDPNGLVYYKGEWHMMYQHNPYGIIGSLKHWGHAVSTDLLHWKLRPSSVVPDDFGSNHSGGAVVDLFNSTGLQQGDDKTLIAFWTSAGHFTSPTSLFRQCISYSNDRGRTWNKYHGNPVIGHILGRNRDPNVIWFEEENCWIMTLYLEGNSYAILKSTDLLNWEMVNQIIMPARECPDLFRLPLDGNQKEMRWVFWGGNGNYIVGNFDGTHFTAKGEAQRTHYGNRYYAAMTFNNAPDNRIVQIGWLTGRRPFQDRNSNFMCQLSIPNELTLRTNDEGTPVLYSNPVRELQDLREDQYLIEHKDLMSCIPYVANFESELIDLEVEIEILEGKEIIVNIRGTQVIYHCDEGKLVCEDQEVQVEKNSKRIRLRALVDRCSLELFWNEGAKAVFISTTMDPSNRNISFSSIGGNARIEKLILYSLKSIWE